MKINQLSVHVATTTRRVGDKVYHSHLLRHSFRENGKVKNVTVANLSMLPESVIDVIRVALKGHAVVPSEQAFEESDPNRVLEALGVPGKLRVRFCTSSR